MSRIIFSKYSNDRADMFKIRTDILEEENGNRVVCKSPLKKDAEEHIRNLYRNYIALKEKYKDTELSINHCSLEGNTAVLEYVSGKTLEEYLDELLRQEEEKDHFFETLDRYISLVKCGSEGKKFEISDSFQMVFGNMDFPMQLEAVDLSNIDMLFENIIISDTITIIDYEWTFPFMVPVHYILYRAFSAFACGLYEGRKRSITLEDLCKYAGITPEEIEIYRDMSNHFAEYVMSGKKTMKEIHGMIGQKIYSMQHFIKKSENDLILRGIQIFPDFGEGYSEKDSFFQEAKQSEEENALEISVLCNKRYNALRIDPAITRCICRIEAVLADNASCEYSTNGVVCGDLIVFNTDDPQIYIRNLEHTEQIIIKGRLWIMPERITEAISNLINDKSVEISELNKQLVFVNEAAENNKAESDKVIHEYLQIIEERGERIQELEKIHREQTEDLYHKINQLASENQKTEQENQQYLQNNSELQQTIKNLQQTIENMKQTKAWRLYEKYLSVTGKNKQV